MRFAVLGSPIDHSLSPELHNFAYRALGVSASYERHEVRKGELRQFLDSHSNQEWCGFSLTMPLKEEALGLCTKMDEDAARASSINTLKRTSNGWEGFNTDVFGFRFLISRIVEYSKVRNGRIEEDLAVSVIGAGGTARAALVALDDFDFRVKVYRRNESRDEGLKLANDKIEIADWTNWCESFNSSLVINCAPIEAMESLSSKDLISGFLIDALYKPWPTPLMKIAANEKLFSGKDLLVSQALKQLEIFLDTPIEYGRLFSELRDQI